MDGVDRGYTPGDEDGPRTAEELFVLPDFLGLVEGGHAPVEYDDDGLPVIPPEFKTDPTDGLPTVQGEE